MLWLQTGTDDVLERIRGQTNDLQVELLVDPLDPMPADLGTQLRTAYTLGVQQNVSLVIWFVKQADGDRHFVVNIAIPKTQRLLTRDLGPSDTGSGDSGLSSAVKESAALVVRAAIQAVRSGLTIGEVRAAGFGDVTAPQTASAVPPEGAAPAAPIADGKPGAWRDATDVPRQAPEANAASLANRNWPWAIGAEWLAVYDGPKRHPIAECASLRAERRVQSMTAFMSGGVCLSRDFDNTHGTFRIERQQAALGASVILLQTGIEANLGAELGAVFYERNTLPRGPGLYSVGAPTTLTIGRFSPEFRLRFPARGSRLQAGVTLGADFLTSSVKIGYRVYDGTQRSSNFTFDQMTQIGVVQPYVALGLAIRF